MVRGIAVRRSCHLLRRSDAYKWSPTCLKPNGHDVSLKSTHTKKIVPDFFFYWYSNLCVCMSVVNVNDIACSMHSMGTALSWSPFFLQTPWLYGMFCLSCGWMTEGLQTFLRTFHYHKFKISDWVETRSEHGLRKFERNPQTRIILKLCSPMIWNNAQGWHYYKFHKFSPIWTHTTKWFSYTSMHKMEYKLSYKLVVSIL